MTEATGVLEAARYAGFAAGPLLAARLTALRPAAGAADQRPELPRHRGGGRRDAGPAPARPEHSVTERSRPLDGLRLLHSDRVLRVMIGAAVGALLFISAALTVEIFY